MQGYDGILVLLQDLKSILYGIFLLLAGSLIAAASLLLVVFLPGLGLLAVLPLLAALPLLLAGGLYAWHGWRAHEVTKTQE